MEKVYAPQQTAPIAPGYPGVQPPKGWVPPLGGVLNLIGVYDTDKGVWVGLPLQALTQALVLAEALHTVDRIDERNYVEVTVPDASAAGTAKTKELEVPAGEVWFINRFNLVTEAEVTGNVRVSKFPKVSDVDKKYLGTDQAAGADTDYDLASAGELGAELRLVGGDKLTVVATAGVLTTADRTVTLNLYGRKARRLAE
ncbi:MAG: hypothetical protein PHQ43_15335 [Dehalococcoidales bacterium]|nr:hypothetical protein [Dehalococcoidales bacterium]